MSTEQVVRLISKEAENIQVTVSVAVEKVIWVSSPGPRLFSCLSRIFREMGVKRLVHVQKAILSHKYSCKRPS